MEVHISNIKEREPFRRVSLMSPPAVHTIYGRGLAGYRWALRHLVHRNAVPFERLPYGSLRDQFGDLRLPEGGGRRLVVVVHGGLWKHEWTHDTIEGIAVDLTRRGYVTWNLEYRRVGVGGGWPESFDDVAAALGSAPAVTGIGPKDTIVLGHSAGGAMALWAGGLGKEVAPALVVGLAAMPDLVRAEEEGIGQGSVRKLLGRSRPDPAEYSPLHRLPTGTPAVLAVADGDELIPMSHGKDFAAAAGASRRLRRIHGSYGPSQLVSGPGGGRLEGRGRFCELSHSPVVAGPAEICPALACRAVCTMFSLTTPMSAGWSRVWAES